MRATVFLVIVTTFLCDVAVADSSRTPVGKIVDIAGGQDGLGRQAWITRPGGNGRREALSVGDRICKGDRLEAGSDTRFVVEFLKGGQAIVDSGVEADVSGPNALELTDKSLPRRALTLWDKLEQFDKDREKLQIETAGGVFGIEG